MPEIEIQDFLNIVKDTRPRLLTLCQSFFDRQEMTYDAEDAVQETYLRLWQMRMMISRIIEQPDSVRAEPSLLGYAER